jgi:isochorismate synthase
MQEGDFEISHFLASLREIYPDCVVIAHRLGSCLFVSATPERLVSLDGFRVRTAAVAGSAPRGRSANEEDRLSQALLASAKERHEHEVVKKAIVGSLREVCGDLVGADVPRLLRLEGIQHLETSLEGELLPEVREEIDLLDLVDRLHPTPAVGGAPRAAALDWIERFEDLERGWYAGPMGWMDARGRGEFRVALRSALIRGGRARLFAGAGIVAGSIPERELIETRWKLRALLAPLTEI